MPVNTLMSHLAQGMSEFGLEWGGMIQSVGISGGATLTEH